MYLLFVCDGSMWEPVLNTQYSIVYVFLSVFVLISCIFASWYEIRENVIDSQWAKCFSCLYSCVTCYL